MDFSILVYVIIVIIVLYYLISFWSAESIDLVAAQTTAEEEIIKKEKIKASPNCAYSLWIFVSDMTPVSGGTVSERKIFERTDIGMSLDTSNKLTVKLGTTPIISPTDSISIPLQKWVNILVSIESTSIVLFIDGKMAASKIFSDFVAAESDTTVGGPGAFSGEISHFKYFEDYITVQDAWEIYKHGYGSGFFAGLINKYNLKVAFLKDNSEVTSFKI